MPALNNPRHEQFARLVAAGETPAKAYALVGYRDSNAASCGSRLSKIAKVRSRIVELQEQSARSAIKRHELNQDWVLARLKENVERAMQAIPVLDAEGNSIGEYKWEGNVANRGLELIGKQLGMFRENVDMTMKAEISSQAVILAEHCTLEQLQAMLAAGLQQPALIAGPVVEVQATEVAGKKESSIL